MYCLLILPAVLVFPVPVVFNPWALQSRPSVRVIFVPARFFVCEQAICSSIRLCRNSASLIYTAIKLFSETLWKSNWSLQGACSHLVSNNV
jgi:hypothetical protein